MTIKEDNYQILKNQSISFSNLLKLNGFNYLTNEESLNTNGGWVLEAFMLGYSVEYLRNNKILMARL